MPARPGRACAMRRHRAGGAACARKSCASKRSPFSATNRSPGCSAARVAVHALGQHAAVADQHRSGSSACACSSVIMVTSASVHAPRAPRAPRRRRRRMPHARDFLVVLVALAGDQHHVARRRPGAPRARSPRGGPRSRRARCVPVDAGHDLRRRSPRRLAARVVAGDDHAVGQPRGDARPSAGACPRRGRRRSRTRTTARRRARGQRLQRGERLLQRVGRVRVVDHHARGTPRRRSTRCMRPGHRRSSAQTSAARSAGRRARAAPPITASRLCTL